ncbi:ABC transporter substrate-binding protein [Halorussus salinisoli]|uniref:ABC transporter substrate-binding protein n=1 Tax=Halorussus salinisoli TaxID=2558242 RepID=UPI0010C22402|nr:ABC transporter substrate-binding protein [Halorussus salinisoli]
MPGEGNQKSDRISRRKYLLASSGVLAGMTGYTESQNGDRRASSQSSQKDPLDLNQSTQITYYDRYEWCQDYSTAFNESHDDINVDTRVSPTTASGAYQAAIAQISAGNAPEVIGLDVVQIAKFAELGALRDIGSFASDLEYRGDIFDPLREDFVTYDGKTYAMPFWIDLSMYYYNKEHFEEAGLDPENPPTTWDEYLDANEQLGQNGNLGTASSYGGFFYFPTAWSNGASLFNEDGTECVINSEEGAEALDFWVELNQSDYTTDLVSTGWQTAHDTFVSGDASMVHSGGFALGYVNEQRPEMVENGNLGVAMLPAPDSETDRTSFLGGNSIVITKQAAQNETNLSAAEEFVRWANTDEGMRVTVDNGYFPARSAGFNVPAAQERQEIFDPFQTALEQGTAPPINPDFREVSTALFSGMEPALNGEKSSQAALDDVVSRINSNIL